MRLVYGEICNLNDIHSSSLILIYAFDSNGYAHFTLIPLIPIKLVPLPSYASKLTVKQRLKLLLLLFHPHPQTSSLPPTL